MKEVIFICATAFAITTEILIVDLVKFELRLRMIEQAAQVLRGPKPAPATNLEHL